MKNKIKNLAALILTFAVIMSANEIFGQKSNSKKTYLKLIRTGNKFDNGLEELRLQYIRNGKSVGSISAVSGLPSRQDFRKGKKSVKGSKTPLPQGNWYVHDILWAGGKDVYKGVSWGKGLGPVKIPLTYIPKNGTSRRLILIHLDSNAKTSPGSEGCVALLSISDFKLLVSWLRETDPRLMIVDWGL